MLQFNFSKLGSNSRNEVEILKDMLEKKNQQIINWKTKVSSLQQENISLQNEICCSNCTLPTPPSINFDYVGLPLPEAL